MPVGSTSIQCVALTLTKTQDKFVLCCWGDNLWSQKIVKQHLQAQQLDGGEGGGHLDTGVQAHPRCIGWAVESCSAGYRRETHYKLQTPCTFSLCCNFSLCVSCITLCRTLTGLCGGRWVYKHTSLGCGRCNSTILTDSPRRGAWHRGGVRSNGALEQRDGHLERDKRCSLTQQCFSLKGICILFLLLRTGWTVEWNVMVVERKRVMSNLIKVREQVGPELDHQVPPDLHLCEQQGLCPDVDGWEGLHEELHTLAAA